MTGSDQESSRGSNCHPVTGFFSHFCPSGHFDQLTSCTHFGTDKNQLGFPSPTDTDLDRNFWFTSFPKLFLPLNVGNWLMSLMPAHLSDSVPPPTLPATELLVCRVPSRFFLLLECKLQMNRPIASRCSKSVIPNPGAVAGALHW